MTELKWDQIGERFYETGVDHGVLYIPNTQGEYDNGVSWNGLTAVTESPSGAESNKQYADNTVYVNLVSAEEFGGTIEAFTYPDEFAECDGSAVLSGGVALGQQTRKGFGLGYRTKIANDLDSDLGYKLHLVYGALAAPSEKAHNTVNDSPEALALSWEISTTPVDVPGTHPVTGKPFKPTATLTIDSTKVDAVALATLEGILFGTPGADPRLPLPEEVIALFENTLTVATPTQPTFVAATGVITIPVIVGVTYTRDDTDTVVTGTVTIPVAGQSLIIKAKPKAGYKFPPNTDDDWGFTRSA
jgi:hypothetical protein